MHYSGSYQGYPASSRTSNGKFPKTAMNHSHQVTSRPTVYHPYPTPSTKKSSLGGCGCGSKLPKR
ncbi:hypothetical protein [Priestia abyssalis]|uniref:hypothetical protein n=1 Tax=Priestia abyssalis TaxID=1221450 RepID=UPI00099538B0|nr:hypothetical protein [Priestia abyssalis]